MGILEDAAEELASAIQYAVDTLTGIYNGLVTEYNGKKAYYKAQIGPLTMYRNTVRQIHSGVGPATLNSHIGASQCCEALDSAEERLTKVINRLREL